jgi:hypothetical protein
MRASNNTQNEHFKCPLYLHTDAAQAIGKIEVDVQSLNVDFLTIVGHKVNNLISNNFHMVSIVIVFFFSFMGQKLEPCMLVTA